jgi:transposase-like protein
MPNWMLGIFVHKKNDKNHFAVETYAGMTVTGYTCHECGYKWYVKRKRANTLKEKSND